MKDEKENKKRLLTDEELLAVAGGNFEDPFFEEPARVIPCHWSSERSCAERPECKWVTFPIGGHSACVSAEQAAKEGW